MRRNIDSKLGLSLECETCTWFDTDLINSGGTAPRRLDEGSGICRARPPVVALDNDGIPQTFWPVVDPYEYCAEFEMSVEALEGELGAPEDASATQDEDPEAELLPPIPEPE